MSNSGKRAGSYNVATRGLLLDAAERLFAERGIDTVTLKEIAQESGGNVGQIVYHFGQKEELVRDVVMRRAGVISADRMQLLESYERLVGQDKVALEPVVRAFLEPYFQRLESDDPGWRCYALFIGRNVWDVRLAAVISEAFNPAAKRFIGAIRTAVPALTEADATRAFQFLLSGLYGSTTNDPRFSSLVEDDSETTGYDRYRQVLVPYVVGGIRAIGEMRQTSG